MKLFSSILLKHKILKSKLFNKKWYLQQYPEVRNSSLSPLKHYLQKGWKEGKNPSERFDTNRYLKAYSDVKKLNINPLVHYILHGKKEGRFTFFTEKGESNKQKTNYQPLVSVIIASYNYAHLIKETIDSILKQTYTNYEIIIIDDGSKDNSIEVITPYLDNNKIHLYTHPNFENRGLCETIKLGIEKSRGEFIAFCESDDLWHPQHLEKKIHIINNFNNVQIISNNIELFGDANAIQERMEYLEKMNAFLTEGGNRINLRQNRGMNFIATFSAVMIKKDVLSKLNFDSPTPAWLDFWLYRQILKDHLLFYTNEKLTLWRMHNSFNGLNGAKGHVKRNDLFLAKSDSLLGIAPPARFIKRINLIKKSKYWDETYYRANYGSHLEGLEPAQHYFYLGWKEGYNPSKEFCNDAYLNLYADMQKGRMNPLVHYERHGKKRKIFPVNAIKDSPLTLTDIEAIQQKRKVTKTILFISHELTLTGAPRALLNMVITAKEQGVTPIILSLASGPMENEIKEMGIKLFILPFIHTRMVFGDKLLDQFFSSFDTIVFNTLATISLIKDMHYNPAKKIAWLHEGSISYAHFCKLQDLTTLFAAFDRIYTVGDYAKSFTNPYIQTEKVKNLLYGIPDQAIPSAVSSLNSKITLLLPGTLCKRKGQNVLLKSLWYLAPKTRNKIHIYLAGMPAEKQVTKAVKHSWFTCVEYLGELTHNQMLALYPKVDLILCPSLDDPMPIICTEAMMFSKPIIVTESTGTAQFISSGINGYTIPANSPKALAEAICKIVEHPKELSEWGKNARQIYEKNFSMKEFAHNIKEMIINI